MFRYRVALGIALGASRVLDVGEHDDVVVVGDCDRSNTFGPAGFNEARGVSLAFLIGCWTCANPIEVTRRMYLEITPVKVRTRIHGDLLSLSGCHGARLPDKQQLRRLLIRGRMNAINWIIAQRYGRRKAARFRVRIAG